VYEKSILSKKFIAYMFADMCWTVLLFTGLWKLQDFVLNDRVITSGIGIVSILMGMVVVKGFLQVGYIGSQALVDKYVRVAEIVARKEIATSPIVNTSILSPDADTVILEKETITVEKKDPPTGGPQWPAT